jgi:hypothetical protein
VKDDRLSPNPIRSEFRSYIPNVSHGRTIEFECNPGYLLQGSIGLTCNHGQWMPAERPRCIIGTVLLSAILNASVFLFYREPRATQHCLHGLRSWSSHARRADTRRSIDETFFSMHGFFRSSTSVFFISTTNEFISSHLD